jgi:hypothetical protein
MRTEFPLCLNSTPLKVCEANAIDGGGWFAPESHYGRGNQEDLRCEDLRPGSLSSQQSVHSPPQYSVCLPVPAVLLSVKTAAWKRAVNFCGGRESSRAPSLCLPRRKSAEMRTRFCEVGFPVGWGYDVTRGHRRPCC